MDALAPRTKVLYKGKDKAGEFYRRSFHALFSYVSNRIPEISDELYRIDDALKAGFGWELGAFETWDAVGVAEGLKATLAEGLKVSPWVQDMLDKGITSFYRVNEGQREYYDLTSHTYKVIPGQDQTISLANISDDKVLWKNS